MPYRITYCLSVVALSVFAVACIEAGGDDTIDLPPMCEADVDCDQAQGEICDVGICWGDPPDDLSFGAIIVPPEGRDDLVASEVPELIIEDDGTVEGLVFSDFVVLSGRITLATTTTASIAAQIKIRRPSRIQGGPAYSRTIIAGADVLNGELAFEIRLPKLGPSDTPYQVEIIPDDGTLSDPGTDATPADLAPPLRFSFQGDHDLIGAEWALGDPEQMKLVAGRVVDAAARGLGGMKVFARGRWTFEAATERVSSSGVTDEEGFFAIWIPRAMEDWDYEIIVRPPPGTVAPTLRKQGVFVPDPMDLFPVEIEDLTMPSFPAGARYEIPIRADAPEGGIVPVEGAEVQITTILLDPADQSLNNGVVAFYTTSGITDAMGNVQLDLIPGGADNRPYFVSVSPLPTAEFGAVYAEPVLVGPPNAEASIAVLPDVRLSRRVPVSGSLRSHDGTPVAGAAVAAKPDIAYKWSLDPALQIELDNFRFPTATTDDDGLFVIWLDDSLLGVSAAYSLEFVPGALSQVPRWTVTGIDVEARDDGEGMELGDVQLPPAAYARGEVMTLNGELIVAAEVTLFEISTDNDPCNSAYRPDEDGVCFPPALLRHVSQSDENGVATLVLPDP